MATVCCHRQWRSCFSCDIIVSDYRWCPEIDYLLYYHPPCRYIFTMLSPLARRLFIPSDENLLVFQKEDNLRIEPEWYCPVIPTVLANGCEGIGTGYSTTVPNYNPREIVANIRRLMNGLEPTPMVSCSRLWLDPLVTSKTVLH